MNWSQHYGRQRCSRKAKFILSLSSFSREDTQNGIVQRLLEMCMEGGRFSHGGWEVFLWKFLFTVSLKVRLKKKTPFYMLLRVLKVHWLLAAISMLDVLKAGGHCFLENKAVPWTGCSSNGWWTWKEKVKLGLVLRNWGTWRTGNGGAAGWGHTLAIMNKEQGAQTVSISIFQDFASTVLLIGGTTGLSLEMEALTVLFCFVFSLWPWPSPFHPSDLRSLFVKRVC